MKKWVTVPDFINGYKIIKDFGRINRKRMGIAICRECYEEFEINLYRLHLIKSCGCIKHKVLNALPEIINGFKIIKDLGKEKYKSRKVIAICKVCKQPHEAYAYYLKDRKHCGCLRGKELLCSFRKSHPRLLRIYKCMKARCYNKNDKSFHLYGENGITICDEWLLDVDSFFRWAIDHGYDEKLSIDRIDNTKGYNPDNCRWSDSKTQARNRNFIKLSMEIAKKIREEIKTHTKKFLAEKYGVDVLTIDDVIKNKSWT